MGGMEAKLMAAANPRLYMIFLILVFITSCILLFLQRETGLTIFSVGTSKSANFLHAMCLHDSG